MTLTKKEKKWRDDPWVLVAGGGVFSFLSSLAYDWYKSLPILSSVKAGYSILIKWLNLEVKIWWILALFSALSLIAVTIRRYNVKKIKDKKEAEKLLTSAKPKPKLEPRFLSYKDDVLKKWRWTWNWKLNEIEEDARTWKIIDLTAYCPKCGTTLLYNQPFLKNPSSYECPRDNCDFIVYATSPVYERRDAVLALIQDNI